jgi:hypothetical protein
MPDASVKEITELAKTIIGDREDLKSEAGKTISDRSRLVATHGEGSPQVKAFDDAVGEKKSEKGLAKTLYGPNGQTKEVFIEKGKEYTPPKGWSLKAPEADASGREEDRKTRRIDQQSAQLERLYKDELKTIDSKTSMLKEDDKEEMRSRLEAQKARALELVGDGMSASEAKRRAGKEAGKKKKEPTSRTWKEIADRETSSAAKRYLTKEYGYSEQEAEDIIVTGIQKWYLEDHPKSRISEFIGRDQRRTFVDDLGLVEKSKSRILPPRQSEAASPSSPPQEQGKALKPLTEEVYKEIISKAKTRGEAEKMARDMGYDHTKGYSPRKLTIRQPSGPPVASAPVELPKATSETWKEISAQGTTSKAKAFLMEKYGHSAEEAVAVIRDGIKKGYVK